MSDRPIPARPEEQRRSDRSARAPERRAAESGRLRKPPGHPHLDRHTDSDLDAGAGPETGPPRWLTVAVIVVVALLMLGVVLLHLSGVLGPGLHGGG